MKFLTPFFSPSRVATDMLGLVTLITLADVLALNFLGDLLGLVLGTDFAIAVFLELPLAIFCSL